MSLVLAFLLSGLNHSYLDGLKTRLETIERRFAISAPIRLEGEKLHVEFKTRTFEVKRQFKSASHSNLTTPQSGPDEHGFTIDVERFEHAKAAPLEPMQAVRTGNEPFRAEYVGGYWLYDFQTRQVKGENQAVNVSVAWGRKIDAKLLKELRAALEADSQFIR
jgi:hypothetical protein